MINGSSVKGAGILLIESYKGNPVITLFGKDNMNYSDIGGKTDPGELPEVTAYREGREETANLINILPEELKYYAAYMEFNTYAIYIIYVDGISFDDYAHNVNIIHSQCGTKELHWKETNSMARIPLNEIFMAANQNVNMAKDIYGHIIPIRGRTMAIIRSGYHIINSLILNNPIILHRHLVTNSRLPCLIGTYTYTITGASIYKYKENKKKEGVFAIYIIPDLNDNTDDFLKCKRLHIPLTGFSKNNDNDKIIKYLSKNNKNNDLWTVTIDKLKIKGSRIYFKSNTLNKIMEFLKDNGFKNIKDELFIESYCKIPDINKLKKILKNQKWSFGIIKEKKEGTDIKLVDKYPLYVL